MCFGVLKKFTNICGLLVSEIGQRTLVIIEAGMRRSIAMSEEIDQHTMLPMFLAVAYVHRKSR
jgi:hypothetical protein